VGHHLAELHPAYIASLVQLIMTYGVEYHAREKTALDGFPDPPCGMTFESWNSQGVSLKAAESTTQESWSEYDPKLVHKEESSSPDP
jgi:hypothetical protein